MAQKIVFLDDDSGTLKIAQNILVNDGYEVHTFTEPQDAFDFLDHNQVDLLVTDIMMPAMNGVEAVKNLRKRHAPESLKIIFLTGIFNQDQSEGSGVKVEEEEFEIIRKPIEPQRLMDIVRNVLTT